MYRGQTIIQSMKSHETLIHQNSLQKLLAYLKPTSNPTLSKLACAATRSGMRSSSMVSVPACCMHTIACGGLGFIRTRFGILLST